MSHRSALAVSVALALCFAIGVLVGRDRLFAEMDIAGAAPPSSVPVAVPGGDADRARATDPDGAAPRVLEVPVSDVYPADAAWAEDDDDHDDRFGGDRDDRHEDEDGDEEHDDD